MKKKLFNWIIITNHIYNESFCNIIGITLEKYDDNHEKLKNNKNYDWYHDSNNCIGCTACPKEADEQLPNPLLDYGDNGRKNYIFRMNNFICQTTNNNYKNR